MKVEDKTGDAAGAEYLALEKSARELAKDLDQRLNPDGERATGFALLMIASTPTSIDVPTIMPPRASLALMFAFGDPPEPATWISNTDRENMIRAVEEWLRRAKRLEPTT